MKLPKGKLSSKDIIKKTDVSVEVHQRKLGLQKMDRDKQRFFS